MAVGTTVMIAGTIAGKSRGVFVTGWTEGRKTLARTGEPTPITPSIIAVATVITVKDSAEAILRATDNMLPAGDDIKLIAHSTARVSKRRIYRDPKP